MRATSNLASTLWPPTRPRAQGTRRGNRAQPPSGWAKPWRSPRNRDDATGQQFLCFPLSVVLLAQLIVPKNRCGVPQQGTHPNATPPPKKKPSPCTGPESAERTGRGRGGDQAQASGARVYPKMICDLPPGGWDTRDEGRRQSPKLNEPVHAQPRQRMRAGAGRTGWHAPRGVLGFTRVRATIHCKLFGHAPHKAPSGTTPTHTCIPHTCIPPPHTHTRYLRG